MDLLEVQIAAVCVVGRGGKKSKFRNEVNKIFERRAIYYKTEVHILALFFIISFTKLIPGLSGHSLIHLVQHTLSNPHCSATEKN